MVDINDDERVINRLDSLGFPFPAPDRLLGFGQALIDAEDHLLPIAESIRLALASILSDLPMHRHPADAMNRLDLALLDELKAHIHVWRSQREELCAAADELGYGSTVSASE